MTKKRILCVTALVQLIVSMFPSYAQTDVEQNWWFNVELIVFKRSLSPGNDENFDQARFVIDSSQATNLLYLAALQSASRNNFDSYLHALPLCNIPAATNNKFGASTDFEFQASEQTASQIKQFSDVESNDIAQQTSSTFAMPTIDTSKILSNKTILDNIVAPFERFSKSISEQQSSIDSLEYKVLQEQNVLGSQDEAQLDALEEARNNKIVDLENTIIKINMTIGEFVTKRLSLSCIDTKAPDVKIREFILPNIGPFLFSSSSEFTGYKQLLATSDLVLQDFATKVFRQRDITPLLYTAWRQEVKFGIENAEFYRVRAGEVLQSKQQQTYEQWKIDYQQQSDSETFNDDTTFFETLRINLENSNEVDWLSQEPISNNSDKTFAPQTQYEVDGKIKVYLDYVNQVPYLHIDNEFNHFSLKLNNNGSTQLNSFPLKQRRRVISKQIHYFDHPAFGLIVRLERFTPPVIEELDLNSTEKN
jgi:hypothetical protein